MEIENHPKVGLYTGGNLLEIHKKDLHIVLKHAAGLLVVGEELHLKKETKTSLYEVAEVFRCLTSFCRRR